MPSFYEVLAQVEFIALLISLLYILHFRAEIGAWGQRNDTRNKEVGVLSKALRTYEKRERAHEQQLEDRNREIKYLESRLLKEVRRGNDLSGICGRTYEEQLAALRVRQAAQEMQQEVAKERRQVERERKEAGRLLRLAELKQTEMNQASRKAYTSHGTMTDGSLIVTDKYEQLEAENAALRAEIASWKMETDSALERLSQEKVLHEQAIVELKHPLERLIKKRNVDIADLQSTNASLLSTIEQLRTQLSQKNDAEASTIADLQLTNASLLANTEQLRTQISQENDAAASAIVGDDLTDLQMANDGLMSLVDYLKAELSQKNDAEASTVTAASTVEMETLKKVNANLTASNTQLLNNRMQLNAKIVRWELQARALLSIYRHLVRAATKGSYKIPEPAALPPPPFSDFVKHYTTQLSEEAFGTRCKAVRDELELFAMIVEDGLTKHCKVTPQQLPKWEASHKSVVMTLNEDGTLAEVPRA